MTVIIREGRCIFFREPRNLPQGTLAILPEEQMVAIRKRSEERRVFWIDLIAMPHQLQLLNNMVTEKADQV